MVSFHINYLSNSSTPSEMKNTSLFCLSLLFLIQVSSCSAPKKDPISDTWIGSFSVKLKKEIYVEGRDTPIGGTARYVISIKKTNDYEVDLYNFNGLRDAWKVKGFEKSDTLFLEGSYASGDEEAVFESSELKGESVQTLSGFLVKSNDRLVADFRTVLEFSDSTATTNNVEEMSPISFIETKAIQKGFLTRVNE
jgi:hypothetical protein